jgi:hypothetical protein
VDGGTSFEELSSPPHAHTLSLTSFPIVWLPEGLHMSEDSSTTAHHRAARIPDRIQTDLLPQSRLDQRFGGHHHLLYMYEYSEGAALCGNGSLRRCCRNIKFSMNLRLASLASSSTLVRERNPHVRSTRVRRDLQLIVTVLLIDRSWEIRGCMHKYFFLHRTPTEGFSP